MGEIFEQNSRTGTYTIPEKIKISKKELVLLLLLKKRHTNNELCKKTGKTKGTIGNQLKKLTEKGLIWKFGHLYYHKYSTKRFCSKLVGLSAKKPIGNLFWRLHKFTLDCPIRLKSKELLKKLDQRLFCEQFPLDFSEYTPKTKNNSIQYFQNKILIIIKEAISFTPELAYAGAIEQALELIDAIENKYKGTKIGTEDYLFRVVDTHLALVNHPTAIKFYELKKQSGNPINYRGSTIHLDSSNGNHEIEFVDPLTAIDNAHTFAESMEKLSDSKISESVFKMGASGGRFLFGRNWPYSKQNYSAGSPYQSVTGSICNQSGTQLIF